VVCADVDDTPILYLFHLGFDTWLAHRAGLIEDVEQEYAAQFAEVAARLAFPEHGLDGPAFDLDDDEAPAIDYFDGDEWGVERVDDSEPVAAPPVPALATFTLPDAPTATWFARAIEQAMRGRGMAKPLFLIDEASRRFPDDTGWKSAALAGWSRRHGFELLDRMLATGGDAAASHKVGNIVHNAASDGDVDVLRRLLDAGASPDARTPYFNATPLHGAAESHRVDAVALLLERGADPAALDRNQSTPLWNALSRFEARADTWRAELPAVARLLVDAGGGRDENAWPIMHRAAKCDHGGVVAFLLEHGIDPERRDHTGDTAIQAAWRARCWESFDALRTAGVRTDTVNANGWSLDQVASPDGRSPRLVDIDVVDGDHDLDVDVEVLFTNGHMADPDAVVDSVRLLERLAAAGVLGLDRYPPGTSIAEWTGDITAIGTTAGQRPLERYRVVGRYHLRAVAPSALGMWLRALDQPRAVLTGAGVADARTAALTVRSVESSTHDRLDLVRWRTDPPWQTVRPWTDLPFEVTEARATGRFCVVTGDPRHHRAIATTLLDMSTADLDLPGPVLLGWAQQHGEHLLVPALSISGDGVPGSIGVLRTLILNALAALPVGTVRRVEWSLGVVDAPDSHHRTRDFENLPDTDLEP
jgi:ankyrin repeat protein